MTAVSVLAAGCVFPSGPGIGLADAALRVGLSLPRQHPFYVDRCGSPVSLSCFDAPDIPYDASRWRALAEASLADLRGQLPDGQTGFPAQAQYKVWLVLPAPGRPGTPQELARAVEFVLADWSGTLRGVEIITGSHAAGVQALAAAAAACTAEPGLNALVLAVDSQGGPLCLSWLEAAGLLHKARRSYRGEVRPNPYGRVPGEGSAAILLSTGHGAGAWCRLVGAATAEEPRTYDQPEPCVGLGLSAAARAALDKAGGRGPLASLTHDLNGEPYRADEYGFTALRLAKRLGAVYQRRIPTLASGDLGAASAVAHTALVAWSCHQRPDGAAHLILASSDDPLRGAVVLQARESESS
jgi:3-oxoacyl-[acyl-carrier-protein] synthase-1